MNNTIRTLQGIIDRNTNEIREVEICLWDAKNEHGVLLDDWLKGELDEGEWFDYKQEYKLFVKLHKDFIKRKANEQRVLKKLIADEIEIANFNRSFDYPTEEEYALIRELSSATNTPEDSFTDRIF